MASLLDQLSGVLDPQIIQQMAGKLGASPEQTQQGLGAALPLLMGALGRNAAQPSGAQAILQAAQRDHAGSDIGSVLQSVLGGAGGGDGQAILGHVLGGRQPRAAQGISAVSGLNAGQSGQLMAMLAPLLMSALGKQTQSQGIDAAGLSSMLQSSSAQPQGGIGSQLLNAVLDKDGDGDVDFADLMAMGSGQSGGSGGGLGGLIGSLFGKR